MDILVRSWQDLGTILAKILSRFCDGIHFAMVRSYQESHVPKKFFCNKILFGKKIMKEVNNNHLCRFTLLDMAIFC